MKFYALLNNKIYTTKQHSLWYRVIWYNVNITALRNETMQKVPYASSIYTVFQKSDAKNQITITTAYLIRIKYPLSGFNYHLSDVNVVNFNKVHRTVPISVN